MISMITLAYCSAEKGVRTPQNLQCEYQNDPLGIDTPQQNKK